MTRTSDVFSSGIAFFEFCTDGVYSFGDRPAKFRMNLLQSNPYNLKLNTKTLLTNQVTANI